jgi:hypothetical protein
VDRSVKDGDIIPGQHLTLRVDFLPYHCHHMDPAKKCAIAIDDAISAFVRKYYEDLGKTFAEKASRSYIETPARNLSLLISDVHLALQNIHEKDDKNHPLFGVKGVCLTRLLHTILSNAYRSIC